MSADKVMQATISLAAYSKTQAVTHEDLGILLKRGPNTILGFNVDACELSALGDLSRGFSAGCVPAEEGVPARLAAFIAKGPSNGVTPVGAFSAAGLVWVSATAGSAVGPVGFALGALLGAMYTMLD